MKKLLSLLMAFIMISMTMSTAANIAAADISSEETIIFPITHDTYLFGGNDYLDPAPGNEGAEIHGGLDHVMLMSKTDNTRRGFGVFKTDALTGLKAQLDSGKMIDKVELQAYLANDSLAISTTTKFFPASTDWDESTINMNTWYNGTYLPNLTYDANYAAYSVDGLPTDETANSYPATNATTYTPMTYDITNTFNKAFESGVGEDSIFSFMMAIDEHTAYKYVLLASSEATEYEPVIKVTVKDIVPITAEEVTLPETEDDSFVLTASNNIKSATVKVNGEALANDAFEISGTSLVISDIWQRLTPYKLEVELFDIYNQKLPKQTYDFTIDYSDNGTPEFICYDKTVTISGRQLQEAEFYFATSFDPAVASDASLVKDYGSSQATEVGNVTFVYDESDSSISLADAVTLDADSFYTIILKAGVQDKFSNVLENDLILALCYASDAPGVTSVKIMDSDFDDYENYESSEPIQALSDGNYVKPVCKINNESDSNKNVLIFTVAYDSEGTFDNMTVSVVETIAQTEAVYAGNSLEVTQDCAYVKAFVWSSDCTILTKAVVASK